MIFRTRREFLRDIGVGGLTASILPQFIFPGNVFAQSASALKFMGTFYIGHGGTHGLELPTSRVPDSTVLSERELGVPRFPTTPVALTSNYNIFQNSLSDFLRSDGSGGQCLNSIFDRRWVDAGLIPYMNIITGSDIHWYYGHGYAVCGNTYTIHNSETPLSGPTLDQAIKLSPLYSPRQNDALVPAIAAHFDGNPMVRALSNPDDITSELVTISPNVNEVSAYNSLIGAALNLNPDAGTRGVTQVVDDLRRLRNSSSISAADRLALQLQESRLLSFLEAIRENSCSFSGGVPAQPLWRQVNWNNDTDGYRAQVAQRISEYIALAASACGRPIFFSSELGAFASQGIHFSQFGEYHENVAHYTTPNPNGSNPAPPIESRVTRIKEALVPWVAKQINDFVLPLAMELKNTPAGGGPNLLDQSLITIVFEAGHRTHEGRGLTMITLGRAQGRLRTNQFVDLRDRTQLIDYRSNTAFINSDPLMVPNLKWVGLPYVNLANTICAAAGIPSNRYEWTSGAGFFSYRDSAHRVPSGLRINSLLL